MAGVLARGDCLVSPLIVTEPGRLAPPARLAYVWRPMAFSTQEILDEFDEANNLEERELRAVYVIRRLKYQRKPGGKFGPAPKAFYKPTVRASQLRLIHYSVPPVVIPKLPNLVREVACLLCRREFGTMAGLLGHLAQRSHCHFYWRAHVST